MKNLGIHEGPVRKGGLGGNNSSNKPDILPAGQGTEKYKQNGVDPGNVICQIMNSQVALYTGDTGRAMAALKKAEKLMMQFCGFKE